MNSKVRYLDTSGSSMARRSTRPWERRHLLSTDWGKGARGGKVRYLDTSGPSMARRSTRPWERRHLLSTDWGIPVPVDDLSVGGPSDCKEAAKRCTERI